MLEGKFLCFRSRSKQNSLQCYCQLLMRGPLRWSPSQWYLVVFLFFVCTKQTKLIFLKICFCLFLCLLPCLFAFLLLFLEAFTTTNQHIYTLSTTSFSSKTSTIIETENRKIEINMNFLLVGGGFFLSLIIFVILLQLYTCQRSTTARTHTFKHKTCKEIGETDESQKKHGIELTRIEIALKRKKSTLNQSVECDYYDVDEIIETRHLQNFTNESKEYELPRSLPKSKHAYLPITVEYSYLSPLFRLYTRSVSSTGPCDIKKQLVITSYCLSYKNL